MAKFKMTKKWRDAKELSKKFLADFDTLSDFIAKDYKELGLTVYLKRDKERRIKLTMGVETGLGFIELHNIMSLSQYKTIDTPQGLIYKHEISIIAVYLLLAKYNYAVCTEDDEAEQETLQEAQLQLISLGIL